MSAALALPADLESWELHLRAENKGHETVKIHGDGVRSFLSWSEAAGVSPVLDRPTVNKFTAHLLEEGAAAETAVSWHLSVRRFSVWLA
jgi:integrase/recombinase XerD